MNDSDSDLLNSILVDTSSSNWSIPSSVLEASLSAVKKLQKSAIKFRTNIELLHFTYVGSGSDFSSAYFFISCQDRLMFLWVEVLGADRRRSCRDFSCAFQKSTFSEWCFPLLIIFILRAFRLEWFQVKRFLLGSFSIGNGNIRLFKRKNLRVIYWFLLPTQLRNMRDRIKKLNKWTFIPFI